MATSSENILRSQPAAGSISEGFTRSVDDGPGRFGRAGLLTGRRSLFSYDRLEGKKGGNFRVLVDTTDRMAPDKAKQRLDEIHKALGLSNVLEHVLYSHDHGLFLCYAFNGASQVGPYERAAYTVILQDQTYSTFEYSTVDTMLGVELRRFFRAYANNVVDACRELYDNCDFEDEDQIQMRAQMVNLAEKRNISRFPWLIADCVEAATNLSSGEYAAVMRSKQSVIGTSVNAVDRRNLSLPVRSAENYDSSTGESVSNAHDIHAGALYK